MKKIFIYSLAALFAIQGAWAADNFFDSMDDATEVKLAPAIKPVASSTSTYSTEGTSLKEEKFNNALTNLDDAQVELRQELAEITAKYNAATEEKEKAIAYCKTLKKEINAINKKMKNVDKSKKIINKNLEEQK